MDVIISRPSTISSLPACIDFRRTIHQILNQLLRIGTRESQLAVWQATRVQELLRDAGHESELVYIKSEGDVDLVTPLYAMGVQGVFTKTLDAALLSGRIDIAVHSMKDVPTQLAQGIVPAAVLERASYKDILVHKGATAFMDDHNSHAVIATSSIRRKAQWLRHFPNHTIENLRGNVNTRLRKVAESNWQGAIFAAAGLERINLRPENSIELNWMLPAPAQGAIMIVCRENDAQMLGACAPLNHPLTELCTYMERSFLNTLMGGCSTPISAWAREENGKILFTGNITATDGSLWADIHKSVSPEAAKNTGITAAKELLAGEGKAVIEKVKALAS